MSDQPEPLVFVRTTLASIDALHQQAADVLDTAEDRNAALTAIGEMIVRFKELADADLELRNQIAKRIWEAERLSLAKLAERIGVSKGRADQIIREMKKQQAEEGEAHDDGDDEPGR